MSKPDPELLLAFDFGLRRIGVATANLRTATASPLKPLANGKDLPWRELDALIAEWRPARLLVGVPERETAGEIAAAARAFGEALSERYGLPTSTVDETLTSRAARSELIMARRAGMMKKRIRRGSLDSHAACLIAEQWLREL